MRCSLDHMKLAAFSTLLCLTACNNSPSSSVRLNKSCKVDLLSTSCEEQPSSTNESNEMAAISEENPNAIATLSPEVKSRIEKEIVRISSDINLIKMQLAELNKPIDSNENPETTSTSKLAKIDDLLLSLTMLKNQLTSLKSSNVATAAANDFEVAGIEFDEEDVGFDDVDSIVDVQHEEVACTCDAQNDQVDEVVSNVDAKNDHLEVLSIDDAESDEVAYDMDEEEFYEDAYDLDEDQVAYDVDEEEDEWEVASIDQDGKIEEVRDEITQQVVQLEPVKTLETAEPNTQNPLGKIDTLLIKVESIIDQTAELREEVSKLEPQMASEEMTGEDSIAIIEEQSYDQLLAASDQKAGKKKKPQTERVITPSARGCKGNGVRVMGEFLYWRAFEDELQFGTSDFSTNTTLSSGATAASTSEKPLDFKAKFKPGFRVGIGYEMGYDDWALDAIYTYYKTHSSLSNSTSTIPSITTLPTSFLFDIMNFPISGSNLQTTQFDAKWNLHYNVLDLQLGRNFYISKHLTLCPFASLRGAWIPQTVRISGAGATRSSHGVVGLIPFTAFSQQKQHFWCVGPRLGLNTHWLFGKTGLGMFLNGEGSLLYSGYSYRFHVNTTSASDIDDTYYHDVYKRVRLNAELFLGLDYGHCWEKHRLFLDIFAGYNLVYWRSQNEMFNPQTNTILNGDLVFHGLTCGLVFAF